MSRKLLSSETVIGRGEAAEKLRGLADKIEEGRVQLSSGGNSVDLSPGERVEFEIEVEEDADGDTSIEVEIEWSDKEEAGVEIN